MGVYGNMSAKSLPADVMPPVLVTGLLQNDWAVNILRSSVELRIFDGFRDGPTDAKGIAAEANIDARGAQFLLDCLVGLKFLHRSDGGYDLTPTARHYLVSSSPLFMGAYIMRPRQLDMKHERLSEALRSGKPLIETNQQGSAREFFPGLAAALFPTNYAIACLCARKLATDRLPDGSRVLDVGAGSGVWSIPVALSNPRLSADALDFPAVLDVTRQFVQRYGVAGQYSYLAGDWREVEFDDRSYDLVILGQILHSEGRKASMELIEKARAALKPGGRLLIAEFMPDDDRNGPARALMFGINMYLLTTEGCLFTASELIDICSGAGFSNAYRLQLPGLDEESPVLIADN